MRVQHGAVPVGTEVTFKNEEQEHYKVTVLSWDNDEGEVTVSQYDPVALEKGIDRVVIPTDWIICPECGNSGWIPGIPDDERCPVCNPVTELEPDGETLRAIRDKLLYMLGQQIDDEQEYPVSTHQALSLAHGLLTWAYAQHYGGGYTTSIHKSYEGLPAFFDFRGPAGALPELYALFTELDNWFNPRDGGPPVTPGPTRDAQLFDDNDGEPVTLGEFLDKLREKAEQD